MPSLYIKNMVCDRCIYMVGQLFAQTGLQTQSIKLGEVQLATPPTSEQAKQLEAQLREFGFELLTDQKHKTIEKIKTLVIEYIQQDDHLKEKAKLFSTLLAETLHKDYSSLSKLFSAHLSAQFKKTTGFTPSAFRQQKDHHRRPIDKI